MRSIQVTKEIPSSDFIKYKPTSVSHL